MRTKALLRFTNQLLKRSPFSDYGTDRVRLPRPLSVALWHNAPGDDAKGQPVDKSDESMKGHPLKIRAMSRARAEQRAVKDRVATLERLAKRREAENRRHLERAARIHHG